MSTLERREKNRLEELFGMGGGYVLWFSDKAMEEFFSQELKMNIFDKKYVENMPSDSKANFLRGFWQIENDYLVVESIKALIEELENKDYAVRPNDLVPSGEEKQALIKQCQDIAKRLLSGQVNLDNLKDTFTKFDMNYLVKQIKRIESSVHKDPELAIGTAKELVESCCKTILSERGKSILGTPDIPKLTKETLKELKLVPEGVDDEVRGAKIVKRILQNLGTMGNDLTELRGLYGTGHGKTGKTRGLSERHAKLAFGVSVTLVSFLFETHEARR